MNKDMCPVCAQEINTCFHNGETVFDAHYRPGEEGLCQGSGMPISASFQD